LGEKEKALALLEQDYRTGDKALWARYLEAPFDSIRDDPRFISMLRGMNLPLTLVRQPRGVGTATFGSRS
jgi:hypothetical protein